MASSLPYPSFRFLSALLAGFLLGEAGCDSGPKVYPDAFLRSARDNARLPW